MLPIPVFRVEKNANYTTMSNYHLRDSTISFKAKGILSMFLSLPKDWSYSVSGLAAISKEGKDGILSGLKELEAAGYLERHRYRNERGRLGDSEYVIYEIPPHRRPVPATPEQGLPKLEKPALEKPVLDIPDRERPAQDIPAREKPMQDKPRPPQSAAPALPRRSGRELSDLELSLLRILDDKIPLLIDEAADRLQLPVAQVLSAVTIMEIDGLIRREGMRKYLRTVEVEETKE